MDHPSERPSQVSVSLGWFRCHLPPSAVIHLGKFRGGNLSSQLQPKYHSTKMQAARPAALALLCAGSMDFLGPALRWYAVVRPFCHAQPKSRHMFTKATRLALESAAARPSRSFINGSHAHTHIFFSAQMCARFAEAFSFMH